MKNETLINMLRDPNKAHDWSDIMEEAIELLGKDACRYQYLRSQPESCEPDCVDVVLWSAGDEACNDGIGIRGDLLDLEIDKRMKEARCPLPTIT